MDIAWMHNAGNLHDVKDAGIIDYGTGNMNSYCYKSNAERVLKRWLRG